MHVCEECIRYLTSIDGRKKLIIIPLYANLKFIDQLKVFEKTPPNTRKIMSINFLCIANVIYLVYRILQLDIHHWQW